MTPSQPPNAVPVLTKELAERVTVIQVYDGGGLSKLTVAAREALNAVQDGRVRCVPVMTEAEIRVEFEAWMKSFNSSARIQWNEQAVLVRYDGTSRSFDVTGKWEAYLAAFRHLRLVGGEG